MKFNWQIYVSSTERELAEIRVRFDSYASQHGDLFLRKEAKANGYNPNVWFDQVENVVAHSVGQETVK